MTKTAKNSEVSRYLTGNIISVVDDVKLSSIDQQMMLMNLKSTGYVGNEYAHRGFPTYEKCKKIMDFLCEEEVS